MSSLRGAAKILKTAKRLLLSDEIGGSAIARSGCIEKAIPILDPNHKLYAWFAPVSVANLLTAFLVFKPDGTLMRYSSFQRHEESLEGCPIAKYWIDTETILQRIKNSLQADEQVREIYLSYDGTPSRIAWSAEIESPDGSYRKLYIAGEIVWEAVSTSISSSDPNGIY